MKDQLKDVLSGFLCVVLALGLAQCKPKDPSTSSAEPGAAEPGKPQAPPKPASLADHAGKLGFAASLPQNTEFYLGTVNFKAHLDALKKSAYYQQVNAIVEDSTPAPTAGDKSLETLKNLWGDDFFITAGSGFAQSATLLKDFNRLYNEVYFKALMTGGAASLQGASNANNPLIYMQVFLNDPAALERMGKFVSEFELPPLIIGLKTDKAEERLKELITPEVLKQLEQQQITLSDMKTADGSDFKVATLEVVKLLPENNQAPALSQLPEDMPEQSRKIIEKAYDDLQSKKLLFAWGVVKGHVIIACGKNLDHLNFATTPASSLLSKPEMAYLLPFMEKNLNALAYVSAASVDAANDDMPVAPMLRGVVAAMKENETFRELGETLDKQLAELAPLESKVYDRECTHLVGAGWWDKGMHFETVGGVKPRFALGDKPLQYAGLATQPGVVFGIDYHRNVEYETDFQQWAEKLVGMTYSTAQQLLKAGIAGPESAQKFAMFETMLVPTLQKIYAADKEMSAKGLGTETAYVVDINGKMPALPGVPPESKGMKFPRITSLHEVADRKALSAGWSAISTSINDASTAFSGGQPGAAPLFTIPDPITSDKNGVTTYFFGLPFFSGDLLPCASVNDKLLVLSTSKEAAESFAGELSKPATKSVTGVIWKFDVGALADYAVNVSTISPTQTPEQAAQMKENIKWVKPFHAMQGALTEKNGQWHTTLDWEIKDVVSFD